MERLALRIELVEIAEHAKDIFAVGDDAFR
jgi:hypothetical protein